jgi:hypothetical protein
MTGIERHWKEIAEAERAEKRAQLDSHLAKVRELEFDLGVSGLHLQQEAGVMFSSCLRTVSGSCPNRVIQ